MSRTKKDTRSHILETTWRLMEKQQGRGVRLSDIAAAAGLSRQAIYLHFANRTDLMVATTQYMDEALDLNKRLAVWGSAADGGAKLDAFIAFWGAYLPEIYPVARALMVSLEDDEAAAAAWHDRMQAVRSGCGDTMQRLEEEELLATCWTVDQAADLLWSMISVESWVRLTAEAGWTQADFIERLQVAARRVFVAD